MFGSDIAGEFVFAVLAGNQPNVTIVQPSPGVLTPARAAIATAVGNRIENLSIASGQLPAVVHYAETGPYGGPADGEIESEDLSYPVRFVCEGASSDPIRAAASAALKVLKDAAGTVVYGGETFEVIVRVTAEFVLPLPPENGVFYRQLGFYCQVQVFKQS